MQSDRGPSERYVARVNVRARIVALVTLAAAAACQSVAPSTVPVSASTSPIAADIDTLASREFNGREAGTAGADSAADFLARRYERLGIRGAFRYACDAAPRCAPSYFQPFRNSSSESHNVGAIVDGLDSARHEYVLVGAHFDHLGHSPTWALDRRAGFVLRPGADDNASGTAVVLELARRFAAHPTRRTVLFVNFDAEEEGLMGSRALVMAPPMPKSAMVFMLNLDMVGRLRDNRLIVESDRMSRADRAAFDSAAKATSLRAQFIRSDGRSDAASFEDERIAAANVSTGMHDDYHTAADIPARINVSGLSRVADFAESVVRTIANR